MAQEKYASSTLIKAATRLSPIDESNNGFGELKYRSRLFRKLFDGGFNVEQTKGAKNGMNYVEFWDSTPVGKNQLSRRVFLYYSETDPKKVIGLEIKTYSLSGSTVLEISKNEVSGRFEGEKEVYWGIETDNTGKIIHQSYNVDHHITQNLREFKRSEISLLKKAGFDPALMSVVTALKRDGLEISKSDKMREWMKLPLMADFGLLISLAIAIVAKNIPNNPIETEMIFGTWASMTVPFIYFLNQFSVIRRGLAVPFREQLMLAGNSKDMGLLANAYRSWLNHRAIPKIKK